MKSRLLLISTVALAIGAPTGSQAATPQEDLKAFDAYFKKRFPDTPFEDYVNGVYSIDAASREQWEAIEEFPPYEINIENGEQLYTTPFANGKTYATCFGEDVTQVKSKYPHFDSKSGTVKTLELAVNECREANGEKPLKYGKGEIADISAYLAFEGRGNPIDIQIPDDPRAVEWYEKGKHHYYAKRGQLNMACADCHIYNSGSKVRADLLSPALGQPSHFPVYRSKWGGLGTLHRRYEGCNKQVRAKPFPLQGEEYRALEYFHTYMSNGLDWNGPGARK